MTDLLLEILSIASPTFHESKKIEFIQNWLQKNAFEGELTRHNNNLIYEINVDKSLPTIGLIGHCDVVPAHFEPKIESGKIYGAGVSDMHAGFVAFLDLLKKTDVKLKYNIVLIIYCQEEGTPLEKNGLYDVIKHHKQKVEQIDVAIVGEPTDNTLQLGCVGSLHVNVCVYGKAAHSARPWTGENALYNALPLINHMANLKEKTVDVNNLEFKDVISITECEISKGRTTIPDECILNINYRFAPNKSQQEAFAFVQELVKNQLDCKYDLTLVDSVPAGKIINSDLLEDCINQLGFRIQAKQAWTDVAQLSELAIPSFNCGPGHQAQAHTKNEYASLALISEYAKKLKQLIYTK